MDNHADRKPTGAEAAAPSPNWSSLLAEVFEELEQERQPFKAEVEAEKPELKALHKEFEEEVERRFSKWCEEQDAEEAAAEPTEGGSLDTIEEIEAEKAAAAETQAANLAICKDHKPPAVEGRDLFAGTADAFATLGLESTRESIKQFAINRTRPDGARFANLAQMQRLDGRLVVILREKFLSKADRKRLAEGEEPPGGGRVQLLRSEIEKSVKR